MARSIWTGSLSFGLVSIPVGLYAATEDKAIRFHQFQEGTADRIRNKRVNERTGEEVEYTAIVKGYDTGGGEYVIVTPEELEAVEPGATRTVEIVDFVDLEAIDPIYYKSSYYLAPQGNDAQRAYALLRQAMGSAKKVAIATLVMRSKQHLVAVRPDEKVLVLETMYFHDEVRDPTTEIGSLPDTQTFKPRELETAKLLIDSLSTEWDPTNYSDTYRERVEELIARKRHGEVVVTASDGTRAAPVVDLMDALQASVEAARNHRPGNAAVAPLVSVTTGTPKVTKGTPKKAAASSPPAGRSTAGRTTAKGGSGRTKMAEDLASLSKAELVKRAASLGIDGRSKMTRSQLAAAIADAPAPTSRRRQAS